MLLLVLFESHFASLSVFSYAWHSLRYLRNTVSQRTQNNTAKGAKIHAMTTEILGVNTFQLRRKWSAISSRSSRFPGIFFHVASDIATISTCCVTHLYVQIIIQQTQLYVFEFSCCAANQTYKSATQVKPNRTTIAGSIMITIQKQS